MSYATGLSLSRRNTGQMIASRMAIRDEPGRLSQEISVVFLTKVSVVHGQFLK